MQLLIGMSMRRYLPAIGTAGLLRSLVSGIEPGAAAAAEDQAENVLHGAASLEEQGQ